jgi:hypothetical protein
MTNILDAMDSIKRIDGSFRFAFFPLIVAVIVVITQAAKHQRISAV